MTRLERHYQKQIRRRVYIFAGIVVLCVILFFTVGLPLLLNGSISLSNLFTGKKDETDSRNPVLQTIQVDTPPEAINKSAVTISGHVANFDSIQIFVNDTKAVEKSVSSAGDFSEEITLDKGKNDIYVVAKAKNQEKKSDI